MSDLQDCSEKKSKNWEEKMARELRRPATYQLNGKKMIVTSVFQEEGRETLGSILVKLARGDLHPHS